MNFRNLTFNIALAIRSIRDNKLRSGITICIIALGIMALVGILTAIEGLKASIYTTFSSMGSNTFQITNQMLISKSKAGRMRIPSVDQKNISFEDAMAFKNRFYFPASISFIGTNIATASFGSVKTNPNVMVMGTDENYLTVSGTDLQAGRNFSLAELNGGGYVCILGSEIANKLFDDKPLSALHKTISVGYVKYTVIGVGESKGSNMFSDVNNNIFIPLQNARAVYGSSNQSFVISVHVANVAMLDMATSEAEGLFRIIRKINPGGQENFSINKNDNLASIVMGNISYVSVAAVFIGFITLLGAAIGLMNILLVSVAERTREIGVSKALGAKSRFIKNQFLTESVIISLTGGALGVFFGILMGNIVSVFFKSGFIVPWIWIFLGFSLCFIVGLIAGAYPAARAAKLDPIQALRYE